MDFNFGNNDEPVKPEGNGETFSFNPENIGADANNSVADEPAAFDWTPEGTADSEESAQIFSEDSEQIPEDFVNGDSADEEGAQVITDISDDAFEEVVSEVEDDLVNNNSDESSEEQASEDVFDEVSEETDAESEAPAFDSEVLEEQPEADAQEDDQPNELEESQVEEDAIDLPQPEPAPLPAALDKKVRTPDGEQEYLLSELIDVETGEPLDLTSLIPEELLSGAEAAVAASGFAFGGSEPAAGGFDMSAGSEAPATSKKKRPVRPKTEKKKGSGVVSYILGLLLALILFPYVMAIFALCGWESNFPVPAPGIPSTYKHIPEWWPEWAMFVFPGRTATVDNPADNPADNAAPKADADANAPEGDEQVPLDADDQAEQPDQLNDAAADDGDFDPAAFLGNEGENNAQPADAPADNEPAELGVVNAPVYASDDVNAAFGKFASAFRTANKNVDDAVYTALNDMAEKSAFADSIDDAVMGKVRTVMSNFGTKDALASAVSEKWAARAEDAADNAGVLLVGTLTDVSERDGYQINAITVEGQDGVVEVVGLDKIEPSVGDKVVVCGKRIADPAKNLGGFTDNGQPVVWGGIVIKAGTK